MKLTIGFSPCPNDTFIFDAMVNGKIDTKGIDFEYVPEDVETLNRWAIEGKLNITKLSYNTFLQCVDTYALLHSGSALGKGVGPLLISKTPKSLDEINDLHIAIPGKNTTANLLLTLAYPQATNKTEYIFSAIEDAVLNEEVDAGLIIHENRFTYQQRGLHKIMDLGDWWEQSTGAAIPLGGIVAKRSMDKELIATVDSIIKESIQYSWEHYPNLAGFVIDNAQEMEEDVMRQHIELYVNEYSTELGAVGEQAINTLFEKAVQAGIINKMPEQIFY
ncbi:MAG: 1,4-dihydroxy-6-naphthoate synthase [Chitinophagales bacterium]|nr:1,4-dihydroxy-6-naphthoate synthase [Chitinophagaceae bacterium]MCB9065260.1 1,4-dihydroxy-6-naphthoate synthase [Chitinophagales bacterium]